jgi:hypothetical protein
MDNDYEKLLAADIDRELRGLPGLRAPAGIVDRVMQALQQRAQLPWYQQAWPAWPPALRFASLALLLAMLGGLCFAGGKVSQFEAFASCLSRIGSWFAGFSAVWSAIHVLLNTLVLVLKHLGTGFLIACLVALGAGYAMCLGLGSVCLRLAGARR